MFKKTNYLKQPELRPPIYIKILKNIIKKLYQFCIILLQKDEDGLSNTR